MKVKEKSIELCVLECICHSAFLFSVITLIWFLFAEEDCMNYYMLLMVILSEMGMYYLRRHIHQAWLFIGTLILYIGSVWVMASLLGMEYFFAAVVMSIHCIIVGYVKKYDIEVPSTFLAGLMVFSGICIWLANSRKLLLVFYVCEALYILSIFIYRNIKKADEFIWNNRRTAFLSVSQIKNANHLITIMLTVILIIAAAVSALLFTPLMNYLRYPVMSAISWVTSDHDMPPIQDLMEEPDVEVGDGVLDGAGGAFPMILNIILGLMSLVMVVVVVFMVISIIKALSISPRDGDIKEYIIPKHKEKIQKVEKAEKKEKTDDRPSKKIRKIYKNTIKSRVKKDNIIPKASTPNEQRSLAKLEGAGTDEFIGLYYKARYSDKECTEEDVEKMKGYS